MKVHATVESKKGFYCEVEVESHNLKAALDKVREALDTVPDEIDGVKFLDWTMITIEIMR